MSVRVLFFAAYRDLVGRDGVDLSMATPATVGMVLARLREVEPATLALPDRPLVAVNQVHARLDAAVADGDEVALLPPLAGG